MVEGEGEAHALDQAVENGFVESDFPSGLAPSVTTLYVGCFEDCENGVKRERQRRRREKWVNDIFEKCERFSLSREDDELRSCCVEC